MSCFNVVNLNCNEVKNYIINKNNCVDCIFKLNDNVCELKISIHFEWIYVNFKQILCILEMVKNILHVKQNQTK